MITFKEQQLIIDQLHEDFEVIQILTKSMENFLDKHPEFDKEILKDEDKNKLLDCMFRLMARGKVLAETIAKFEGNIDDVGFNDDGFLVKTEKKKVLN